MSSKNPDTRTRILQAALKLLESQPGTPARMSDIAKAAGISRQALYLHFPSRTELFIATTRYQDEVNEVDRQLASSREAITGPERLTAWITAWGSYIPQIYGVAKTLMLMKATDAEAAQAWDQRMQDVREGCAAAVQAMADDGTLRPGLAPKAATDMLWTMLSLPVWEQLTQACGWTQEAYLAHVTDMARRALMKGV